MGLKITGPADAGRKASRVLFVTRRFPPSVGGMETLAAEVDEILRNRGRVELVALRKGSLAHLAWFLPLALARTSAALLRGGVERVVCGDAIVWMAVSPVVRVARQRNAVMVLGLDVTYPNPLYQRIVRRALPHADRVVAISKATGTAAIAAGADEAHMAIVTPGVDSRVVGTEERARHRRNIEVELHIEPGSLILITLGRLVRRKGVAWFVEHVLPRLPEDAVFLIVGEGPMREEIEAAVGRSGAATKVRMVGRVDDRYRESLLAASDIAVMPNISVVGDMEGFGQVAVEAACHGCVVVAARLEGVAEAVVDGTTGKLVEPEDAEAFIAAIKDLHASREEMRRLSIEYQRNAATLHSPERMARELPRALGLDDDAG